MTGDGRDVLNLFYRLDPAVWGDGVAGEAATAVARWADTHRPGVPVAARIRPANSPPRGSRNGPACAALRTWTWPVRTAPT
ncbi:GNAT family N-acetyltransferase [Micromonospora sp. WMMD998]|uniref:GNAT family N-acetyltransferase n=1 Tax=Micromonospora sp. WMMD998 TaxID=3016092 RepID=UPI00249CD25C|nr:GNAT family N-acetyltransferase [Micromonospora sp. WMMD998]WFE40151.1 hypothetical protein O7619_17570 [Micromonospora sp. WMMD998]